MIKLIKSTFYKEKETKKKLAKFILNSSSLSMGKECQKFEKQFAKKQGREYAVFVSSGSMANLILLQSLMNLNYLKKLDNVGASALTWATNIMPIVQLGMNPVVFDCEIENLNVSSKILKNTSAGMQALFLTNALGFSADIDKIAELCKQKNIILIEDNCESLGSKTAGKLLGNFGLASTFSTFVGHHLSTIEGGMICTDDEKLHEMLLMVRAHGWDRNLPPAKQNLWRRKFNVDEFYAKYTFFALAYNGRPTEIQGFVGNLQIKYWNEIISKRFSNFKKLVNAMEDNNDIIKLNLSHMDFISNFATPLVFKTKKLFNRYRKKFAKAAIELRPIIAGDITKQPFFVSTPELPRFNCPNASFIHQNGFYFCNNPELSNEELNLLCNLLKK